MRSPGGGSNRWARGLGRPEPLAASAFAHPGAGASETEPAVPPGPDSRPRRRRLHAALVTIRPRQWIKNALVIAAPGAAGALTHDDVPLRVALACAAFCLLASGLYAINDVRDRHEDRHHPRKRHRPVAAGELEPGSALGLGVALMLAGLALCALIRPELAVVGAAYLVLTLSYTMVWRRVPILDVVAIAGGFVLRAIAGGVAAPVTLSRWFVLVVTFTAVLVASGKRNAELRRADDGLTRRVLRFYSAARLRLILVASAVGAFAAYCAWAFELAAVSGIPWRLLTIVPFAACLLRYGALVGRGEGEAPEDVLLADHWLQVAGIVWLALFALGVDAAG